MVLMIVILNFLILSQVYNYNYFNQLRQDMQNKVEIIAKTIQIIYKNRCNKKQFTCPVKTFNLCQGTDKRQCINNFPAVTNCNGLGYLSMTSGVKIPNAYTIKQLPQNLKQFICASATIEFQQLVRDELSDNSGIHGWIYFGSSTGVTRVSPGFKFKKQNNTESCLNYDCRTRQWYTQNVYQRKKVVILIQNSKRVIQQQSRFQTIKLSLQALLKTSQKGDYFNIIQFSDTANSIFSEQQLKLISLRDKINQFQQKNGTKDLFYQNLINKLTISNNSQTNYKNALQLATKIINNSKYENPQYQNLILMFSAFKPTNYSDISFDQLEKILNDKEKQIKQNIIFFGFGVKMVQDEGKQLLKQLACSFNGIFIQIQDVIYQSMFLDQAQAYYLYLIQGNQVNYTQWTEFYDDQWQLGKVVSVNRVAYYKQNNISKVIGLASIDVLVKKLTAYKSQELIKKFLQVTQLPFKRNINHCALQTLRGVNKCTDFCLQYKFCEPKITNIAQQIISLPLDKSNDSCCSFIQQSKLALTLGLIFGIAITIIILLLIFYFFFYRKNSDSILDQTYADIFKQFKDFDQTRIRSDSQISIIKQ